MVSTTEKTILIIDLGTSSAKAVLFDLTGHVRAEAEMPYETHAFAGGRQEQDPLDWWAACVEAVRGLGDLSSVGSISLAGTMQSVIPLDADGAPVRSAILYSDSRADEVFRRFAPLFEQLHAGAIIGNHINELMSVFKIAWLREHQPDLYRKTSMFHSGAKDYISYRMTGEHVTDPTAATTVGLMDVKLRRWVSVLADAVGIALENLPRIEPADFEVGRLARNAARELGVREGLSVINGCGDAGAATIGAGVSRPGQAYIYLGTSAWVALVREVEAVGLPHDLYTLAHPAPGLVIRIGAMLSGGDSVAWFRRIANGKFEDLEHQLTAVDQSPPEVLFLPYLKGERCPFYDPKVRGAFLGLDRSHGPTELFYSVLEGVAMALRANMEALGVGGEEIRLIGGGAVNAVWPQLIADVTGRSIVVTHMPAAATAFGAFSIAAARLGVRPTLTEWSSPVAPRPHRAAHCERRRHLFDDATRFAREFAVRL